MKEYKKMINNIKVKINKRSENNYNKIKSEKGIGLIGVILLIIFVVACIGLISNGVKNEFKKEDDSTVASDMLLVQGACKVLNDNASVLKQGTELVGTKLSEFTNSDENVENVVENSTPSENSTSENNVSDEINGIKKNTIKDFLNKNIITTDFDKYYVLKDEDLQKLNLDVRNQKDSYYIVNYEKNEVYTTKAVDGKYKVDDIK